MKFKKTLCLFLAGLTLTAATINFTISGKDSGFSKLMKNNVEAKTKSFWDVVYLLIEGLLESNSTYSIIETAYAGCPSITIFDGVVMEGSDAAKQLMMMFSADAEYDAGSSGKVNASFNYKTTKNKTDAYHFKYKCDMVFSGLWEYGFCKSCSPNDSGAMLNCKSYDSCSQLANLRIETIKNLLPGK